MRVVFIALDTTRPDHLSCYGYHRPTTPNIDRLAEGGVIFENAYASDVPTQPCFTSVFSGRRGVKTGIVTHGQPQEEILESKVPFFTEALAREGIQTAAVSTLYSFRPWFARGFQHYMRPKYAASVQKVIGDDINELALPWLRAYGQKDFFLFIHYWDPHTPYHLIPEKYWDMFYDGDPYDPDNRSLDPNKEVPAWWRFKGNLVRALGDGTREVTDMEYVLARHDACIKYVDDKVGEVIEVLENLKVLDDTLFIIFSDHGEAFTEHDCSIDHVSCYEEVCHVPLIFSHPSLASGGKKAECLVQMIDVAPTILESFGISAPELYQGRSLWPIIQGDTDKGYETVYCNQGLWQANRMIRTNRWTLIKNIDTGVWDKPATELFDMKNDPKQAKNLYEVETDVAGELELRLARWLEAQLGERPDPLRVCAERGIAGTRMREAQQRSTR
jgi:arylsulfatase